VRDGQVRDALVRIRVAAGHQHDVAVVGHGHALALLRRMPGQERRRAHVVVDQRAAVARLSVVRQGAVQQVAVEKDDRPGLDLDGHGVFILVGEALRLLRAVEARVVSIVQLPQDARLVRAGNHPEAAVLGRGPVHRNPGAGQRAVTGRDEVLILVPGLAGLACCLDEQHRLHALDVWSDDVGQHIHDDRVGQVVVHDVGQLVREVDTEIPLHHIVIRLAGQRGRDPAHLACVAAADAHGIAAQLLDFGGGQCVVDDQIAVLAEELRFGLTDGRVGVRAFERGRICEHAVLL